MNAKTNTQSAIDIVLKSELLKGFRDELPFRSNYFLNLDNERRFYEAKGISTDLYLMIVKDESFNFYIGIGIWNYDTYYQKKQPTVVEICSSNMKPIASNEIGTVQFAASGTNVDYVVIPLV